MVLDDRQSLLMTEKTVGRYEIVAPIGAGGMGSVYIGRLVGPAGFERLAAIKVIHPHLAKQPTFINMFMDEARLAARIHHPNVVEIFEVGNDRGIYYMVGELISGQDLHAVVERSLLRVQKISLCFWAGVIADIAKGLHEAHELRDENDEPFNLVHRDISTRNILVSYKGYAKLIDFGVASARGRLTETDDGSRKGKVGYMAPEQLCGHKADRRSDIYALGVVLYTVVVGRHPFPFENEGEQVAKMIKGEFPFPHSIQPEIDEGLEHVILRAMAKSPDERFQTADEMCRALQVYIEKERCGDMTKLRATTMASLFDVEISANRETINAHRRRNSFNAPHRPAAHTTRISLHDAGVTQKIAAPLHKENERDLETSESFVEIPLRSMRSVAIPLVLVILGLVVAISLGFRYLNESSLSSEGASLSGDEAMTHDESLVPVSIPVKTQVDRDFDACAAPRSESPSALEPVPVPNEENKIEDLKKVLPKKRRRLEHRTRPAVEEDKPKAVDLKGWELNPFQ
jgi:serine/threonine-protein kinase